MRMTENISLSERVAPRLECVASSHTERSVGRNSRLVLNNIKTYSQYGSVRTGNISVISAMTNSK